MLTPETISRATGAPLTNVQTSWPLLVAAFAERGLDLSGNLAVAVAATIAVETGVSYDADHDGDRDNMTFLPIRELGSEARLNQLYDQRTDLGNTPEADGDGARYAGEGFVQLTGLSNFARAERDVPLPGLVANPALAREPEHAARILAWYFETWRIVAPAQAGNWERVRRRVNGGLNGFKVFMRYVNALLAEDP